jgi:hypothetical protein
MSKDLESVQTVIIPQLSPVVSEAFANSNDFRQVNFITANNPS